jgi:hypothetical protein
MQFNLIIVSLIINGILLIWLLILTLALRDYKASYKSASEALKKGKLPQLLEKTERKVENLTKQVEDLYSLDGKLNKRIEDSYRNIGLVRFNAFTDIGGELSFSAALLDDKKNGIVITSISGREESRTFVKEVANGIGEPALSEEEEQAVEKAMAEKR